MLKRRLAGFFAAIALMALSSISSSAQLVSRPVRYIVPFPAGTASDAYARILAAPLSKALGQPVVVENRPGGNGAIAAHMVANAEPDGSTLFQATNSALVYAPIMTKDAGYDSLADFTPITLLGQYTLYVVVPSSLPVKTMADFIAYAKANPGKLNYGTGQTIGILSLGRLMAQTGLKMTHVPYTGEPAAIMDMLAGRIQLMIASPTTALAFIKDGRLRALATTNRQRTAELPKVPTLIECGLPNVHIGSWAAIFAPGKMKPSLANYLNEKINAVLNEPEVVAQFARQSEVFPGSTREHLADYLSEQMSLWRTALRDSGLLRSK